MPALIRLLKPDGLQTVDCEAHSLDSAAALERRDGVYTVSNTFHRTQTLLIDAHLDRLDDSARRKRIPFVCDRPRIRSALRQMILSSGFGDVRFRISVAAAAPNECLLTIEPYRPPAAELIANGARCVTSTAVCRHDPAAKSSDWIHQRAKLESTLPNEIYEILLLDESGRILEGMSSNFYAIRDGILFTAGSGMLAGISRRIVLEICDGFLPVQLSAPRRQDIAAFDEAFMSSSSRGIIPIIEINRQPIGAGAAGPTTRSLQARYQTWVSSRLEEL